MSAQSDPETGREEGGDAGASRGVAPLGAPTAARIGTLVIDTDDPPRLARFYRDLLGWTVDELDDEWACLIGPGGAELGFQISIGHRPPTYPGAGVPQQMHVDFYVDDLAGTTARARALGARPAGVPAGRTFVTLLDPSGHPFCLCLSPELRETAGGRPGEGTLQ